MYDDLVERLRRCSQFKCRECEYYQVIGCRTKLNAEAADAIEKLSREAKSLYAILGTHPDPCGETGDLGMPLLKPKEEN